MVLSVLLGFLSYKYVEKINFPRSFPTLLSYLKCKPVYIAGVLGILGSTTFLTNGVYGRFNPTEQLMLKNIESQQSRPPYDKGCFDYVAVPACTYFDGKKLTDNEPSHILFGDSHAQALVNGIAAALSTKDKYTGLKFYGMAGCLFSENIDSIYPEKSNCGTLAREAIKEVTDKYPNIPIIYVNRYSSTILGDNKDPIKENANINYLKLKNDFYQTISKLSENRAIYLVTPTPEFTFPVVVVASKNFIQNDEQRIKMPLGEYYERNNLAFDMFNNVSKLKNVDILDIEPYFCDDVFCYGDENYMPLYRDDDHVSEYGNKKLIPLFNQIE